MEEGRGGEKVTCAQTHMLYIPCGTAVNHNLDELARASRELGTIIYGGRGRLGNKGSVVVEASFTVSHNRFEVTHTGLLSHHLCVCVR